MEEPVSLTLNKILAITMDPAIKIDSWASFRDTSYNVDYYRGMAIVKKRLSVVVKPEKLSTVNQPVHGLKKLMNRRIDVYIDSDKQVLSLLALPEFKDSGLRIVAELESIASYPYLHKKHAELAPRLAEVLKEMKSMGLFEKFLEHVRNQNEE